MIVRLIEYGSHDLIESEVREDGEVHLRRITFELDGHEPIPRRDGQWTGSERRAAPFRLTPEQHAALLADMTPLRGGRSIPLKPDSVLRRHDFIGSVLTLLEDDKVVFDRELVWEGDKGMRYVIAHYNGDDKLAPLVWKYSDMLMPRYAVDETSTNSRVRDLSWRLKPKP